MTTNQFETCLRCGAQIDMSKANVASTNVPKQVKFSYGWGTLDRLWSMACQYANRKPDSKKPCLFQQLSSEGKLQASYSQAKDERPREVREWKSSTNLTPQDILAKLDNYGS
jgi:hypothetical protein